MKIWVQFSRVREKFRAEKLSSNSTRYYSSWFTSQCIYIDSVWHLNLVHLQTTRLIHLWDWYKSWYKISISTNYIFNDIITVLIWTNKLTKNIIESNIWIESRASKRCHRDEERKWDKSYQVRVWRKKEHINYYYSSEFKPRDEPISIQTQVI
jgi:hypothetical protein